MAPDTQEPAPSTDSGSVSTAKADNDSSVVDPSKVKAATTNGTSKGPKPASEEKLSNAEMKKRAKGEKQARRAQERQAAAGAATTAPVGQHQDRGAPKADVGRKAQTQDPGSRIQSPGSKEVHKHQDKRPEARGAESQKSLPVRTAAKHTTSGSTRGDGQEVGLFRHLYGQARRTSLVGAGRDVHPAVLALGLQMSHYVICGSNARCVATLFCLKRVVESYVTPPGLSLSRHLTSHLSPQIDYLRSCRPLSVSMGNAIRWLKLEISKVDIDTAEDDAKAQLCDAIDNFIRERITVADQVIATSAAEKIRDGDVVLTFAKSSIVQQTLTRAYRRGRKFRVIVVDSKPLFEGKHLTRALARLGLEVQYSLMHCISHAVKDATKVLLGAHAIMSNGRLYSRVGTAIVAMMAHEADVPVLVCAESIKFTERVALDSIVTNEIAPSDELLQAPASSSLSSGLSPSMSSTSSSSAPSSAAATPSAAAPVAKGDSTSPAHDGGNSSSSSSNTNAAASSHDNLLQPLNIMYDVTPAEFIKMVVTEFGSLPPSSAPVVHRLSMNTT